MGKARSLISKLRAPLAASYDALVRKEINHYPRKADPGSVSRTIETDELFAEFNKNLSNLKVISSEKATIDDAVKLSRESLNEVKALTDYQDGKATRLLTIITFLSAFSGILFGKFVDLYPLHETITSTSIGLIEKGFIVLTYVAFGLFALAATFGALVTFHAIRTTFKFPKDSAAALATSYLFYKPIVETTPSKWTDAFLSAGGEGIRADLKIEYVKNYITETYLVSCKVADKIRYLMPAQQLQHWAIRFLLLFILFFGASFAFVSPTKANTENGAAYPPTAYMSGYAITTATDSPPAE